MLVWARASPLPLLLRRILLPRRFPLHYYFQILPSSLAVEFEFAAGIGSGRASSPWVTRGSGLEMRYCEPVRRFSESMLLVVAVLRHELASLGPEKHWKIHWIRSIHCWPNESVSSAATGRELLP